MDEREEVETITQGKMRLASSPESCLPRSPAPRSWVCEAVNGKQIQVLLVQWCLPKCCFLRTVGCPRCLLSLFSFSNKPVSFPGSGTWHDAGGIWTQVYSNSFLNLDPTAIRGFGNPAEAPSSYPSLRVLEAVALSKHYRHAAAFLLMSYTWLHTSVPHVIFRPQKCQYLHDPNEELRPEVVNQGP